MLANNARRGHTAIRLPPGCVERYRQFELMRPPLRGLLRLLRQADLFAASPLPEFARYRSVYHGEAEARDGAGSPPIS